MKSLIAVTFILGMILSLATPNQYLIAKEHGSPAPETIGHRRA